MITRPNVNCKVINPTVWRDYISMQISNGHSIVDGLHHGKKFSLLFLALLPTRVFSRHHDEQIMSIKNKSIYRKILEFNTIIRVLLKCARRAKTPSILRVQKPLNVMLLKLTIINWFGRLTKLSPCFLFPMLFHLN